MKAVTITTTTREQAALLAALRLEAAQLRRNLGTLTHIATETRQALDTGNWWPQALPTERALVDHHIHREKVAALSQLAASFGATGEQLQTLLTADAEQFVRIEPQEEDQ